MAVAYCDRGGRIGFARALPDGMLPLARGSLRQLKSLISGSARLARDADVWLVPGVPEAASGLAAVDAVRAYIDWLDAARAKRRAQRFEGAAPSDIARALTEAQRRALIGRQATNWPNRNHLVELGFATGLGLRLDLTERGEAVRAAIAADGRAGA